MFSKQRLLTHPRLIIIVIVMKLKNEEKHRLQRRQGYLVLMNAGGIKQKNGVLSLQVNVLHYLVLVWQKLCDARVFLIFLSGDTFSKEL